MGVYIKGLKMPDCCWNCPCIDGEYGQCNISRKTIRINNGRLADCPLIELPDTESEIDKWWERSETVNAERSEDEPER